MRYVFFGTPDFAVATLEHLVSHGMRPEAVVTAVDKPAGRGRKLQASAVKAYAQEQAIAVMQPRNLKEPSFLEALKGLQADLFVVVAFRMLPEAVWNMPPQGTINLHASLLPAYRGAAPIQWAIIQGETETGVTTFRLKHAIDTGDLLLQRRTPIHLHEDAGSLYQRLMHLGAHLVLDTIAGLEEGTLEPRPQPPAPSGKEAPKLEQSHMQIKWEDDALRIHNQIRGLSPRPGAYTSYEHTKVKILESKLVEGPIPDALCDAAPGAIGWSGKTMYVRCGRGVLAPVRLQIAGKKPMTPPDLHNGRLLPDGTFHRPDAVI